MGAYLFVKRFLAHATDGTIDPAELAEIDAHLASVTDALGITPEERQAHLAEASATYDALLTESGPNSVVREFHRCVRTVQAAYKDEPRVLEDLAMACRRLITIDGEVNPMEAHFMAQVSAAWTNHIPLRGAPAPAKSDLLEAYLFVARFLAEATDGHLDEREWAHIRERLVVQGEALGATPHRCRDALDNATRRFRTLRAASDDAVLVHFRECAEALGEQLAGDPHGGDDLLMELWQLAGADGIIHPEERATLEDLERLWASRV